MDKVLKTLMAKSNKFNNTYEFVGNWVVCYIMSKKAHSKETIKQIATTGTYDISIYVGSADEEFIYDLKQSLDDEKYELIGFESDGKKLIKNIKKYSPNILAMLLLLFRKRGIQLMN